MKQIEFHTRPNGDVEVIQQDKVPYILNETCRELIVELYDTIRNDYPEAFQALSVRYKTSISNHRYFEFLVVRGFIKCNWSTFDDRIDIDERGNFMFEYCACPMRGECKDWNVVCNPKRSSILSPAEINVLRLIVQGMQNSDIAETLFISPNTVHNHRNNILKKLNATNTAQLVTYWHSNNLR